MVGLKTKQGPDLSRSKGYARGLILIEKTPVLFKVLKSSTHKHTYHKYLITINVVT